MGKIFCMVGKSSTGKDTIYKLLQNREELALDRIVTYTTRPIRQGECEGVEYHFTDENGYMSLKAANKIVEERVYNTVHGPWRYFTVNDEGLKQDKNYLMIGTLEAYNGLRRYFGSERVVPIMVTVDDGVRLQRALSREMKQEKPKYEELCRRFLADAEDFSAEKIAEAGIEVFFENVELNQCVENIAEYIQRAISENAMR